MSTMLVAALAVVMHCVSAALQPGSSNVARWNYDVASVYGPPFWDTLASDRDGTQAYPGCAAAQRQQSPIAIVSTSVDPALTPVDFGGYASPGSEAIVGNDGRLLRITAAGTVPTCNWNGNTYALIGAEVHLPAEHALGGSLRDGEIHLVHNSTTSHGYLIIAVTLLASAGGEHIGLRQLLQDHVAPSAPESGRLPPLDPVVNRSSSTLEVDWTTFVPMRQTYMTYDGTWSYPPCTPASVVVLEEPLTLSLDQLGTLMLLSTGGSLAPVSSARPLQQRLEALQVRRYVEGMELRSSGVRVADDLDSEAMSVGRMQLGVSITAIIMSIVSALLFAALVALGFGPTAVIGHGSSTGSQGGRSVL